MPREEERDDDESWGDEWGITDWKWELGGEMMTVHSSTSGKVRKGVWELAAVILDSSSSPPWASHGLPPLVSSDEDEYVERARLDCRTEMFDARRQCLLNVMLHGHSLNTSLSLSHRSWRSCSSARTLVRGLDPESQPKSVKVAPSTSDSRQYQTLLRALIACTFHIANVLMHVKGRVASSAMPA